MNTKETIFEILNKLNIEYSNYEHKPVFSTTEDKLINGEKIPGMRVKSIFIRNKKATNFYIVVLNAEKNLVVQDFRAIVDDSKMSFGEEDLMVEKIGVRPGTVSPFALINNTEKDVKLYIDKELETETIGIHPLQNDNTTVLKTGELKKFLDFIGAEYYFVKL